MAELVYIPGIWDLLHIGHVRVLARAHALGDRLIVGAPTDKVVEQDKGRPPVIPLEQRLYMLNALECVDLALAYDELEFLTHLDRFQPNILAVGGTWGSDQRHLDAEKWICESAARLVQLPYTDGVSTTLIIGRVCESFLPSSQGGEDKEVRDTTDVRRGLPKPPIPVLQRPIYTGAQGDRQIMLAVEAMKRHTADAGWQLQIGLEHAGYTLCGLHLDVDEVQVPTILELTHPDVVVLQDKREWEGRTAGQHNLNMRFKDVECLRERRDIFKLTVLKDAHQNPKYHRDSAREIGAHGWIIYYHPRILKHVAPYVRLDDCIRTYHSVDRDAVPSYSADRKGCLLSGAASRVYPLRTRLIKKRGGLPLTEYLPHPGYHAHGCVTPKYLQKLSQFKVAICTASKYGYALRKLIEATACGCVVLTDLPTDEVLPHIDGNLVRIGSGMDRKKVAELLPELFNSYDAAKQQHFAEEACKFYDYRAVGLRLAENIEKLRISYSLDQCTNKQQFDD